MNKIITATIFILACTFFGTNANAGLILVELDTDQIYVNESVTITINAQNFDETEGFFFDLLFDNSLLGFNFNSLTSGLALFDGLDPFFGLSVDTFSGGLGFDFQTNFLTPVQETLRLPVSR